MLIILIGLIAIVAILFFSSKRKKRTDDRIGRIADAVIQTKMYQQRMAEFCSSVGIDPKKSDFVVNVCAFINIRMNTIYEMKGIGRSEDRNLTQKLRTDNVLIASSTVMIVQGVHMLIAESHSTIDEPAKVRRANILEKCILITLLIDLDEPAAEYERVMLAGQNMLASLKDGHVHLLQSAYDAWTDLFYNPTESNILQLQISYNAIDDHCRGHINY